MDNFKSNPESYDNTETYHSYQFYTRKQQDDEGFESYLMDIFKLGKQCHFKNYDKDAIERLIRDKIIFGLYDQNTRQEIFSKGYVELNDVINHCRASDKKKSQVNHPVHILKDGNAVREGEKIRNGTSKNSGDSSTRSNNFSMSSSAEEMDDDTQENDDNSVLEKGEVSTPKKIKKSSSSKIHENVTPEVIIINDFSENENEVDDDDDKNGNHSDDSSNTDNSKRESEVCYTGRVDSSDSSDSSEECSPASSKMDDVLDVPLFPGNNRSFSKCDNCGEHFSHKFKLEKHVESCYTKVVNHIEPKYFQCMTCPQVFSSQEELDMHELIHPYKTSYACKLCSKAYYDERGLNSHYHSPSHKKIVYSYDKDPKIRKKAKYENEEFF